MQKSLLILLFLTGTTISLPAEEPANATLTGIVVIPKDVADFKDLTVELQLFQYDPRIADKAATLVEKLEWKAFAHTAGKETKKEFTLGAKALLEPTRNYYVTCFIVDAKGNRTHMGKCDHDKDGIGKVLTKGQPKDVTISVATIKH